MIERDVYLERVRRLAEGGPFLAVRRENRIYLSGTDAALFVLVTGDGELMLLVSRMEAERARRESREAQVVPFQRGEVPLRDGEECIFSTASGVVREVVEDIGAGGLRFDVMTEKLHSELSSLGLERSSAVEDMRMIKSPGEIELIRDARRVIGEVFEEVSSGLEGDQTELAVAGRVISSLMSRGVECAFDPIVAFDENSSLPHGHPGKKRLSGASVMLFDIGARVGGYCSDITRTIVRTAGAREELEEVRGAVEEVADGLEVGMHLSEADSIAREYLGERGRLMLHGLGHGLGLAIHEGPVLAAGSDDVLRDGMVFTIEPGIYHEGRYGVRWEEDYLCWGGGVDPIQEMHI